MSPDGPPGAFVAVVGPSGAGKDTLMSGAARHAGLDPRIRFARRVVTRAALVESEDHDSLDEADFARAQGEDAFAITWAAHGLHYGLPRRLTSDVASGRIVVANLSRRALDDAARVFGSLQVVEVTARPEVLLARLLARGRESEQTIRDRLRRQVPVILPSPEVGYLLIDNSADVALAIDRLVRHLAGMCKV